MATIINIFDESARVHPLGYDVGALGHLLGDVHKLQVNWARILKGEIEVQAPLAIVKDILKSRKEFKKLANVLAQK